MGPEARQLWEKDAAERGQRVAQGGPRWTPEDKRGMVTAAALVGAGILGYSIAQ